MKGCPWKIRAEQIVEFFDGYGKLSNDEVFIEKTAGRSTGLALVIFEDADKAQQAKEEKNREKIGDEQRWVSLHDDGDLTV